LVNIFGRTKNKILGHIFSKKLYLEEKKLQHLNSQLQ